MFYREGNPSKIIFGTTPGTGRVLSKLSRPSYSYVQGGIGLAEDKPVLEEPIDYVRDNWSPDDAHTPGMFWWQYLTTGEAFWQEKVLQLAAWSQFLVNSGLSYNSVGNGRANTDMILNGIQPRAYGWQMRNRARAWWAATDNSPEKSLFAKSVTDAAAMYVGIYDLPGVMVGNTIRDAWNTNYLSWYQNSPPTPRPNNLGYMHASGPYPNGGDPDDATNSAMALWMQNFIAQSLWHGVELGFEDLRPLAEWSSKLTIAVATSPEPRHLGDYTFPDTKLNGFYYQTLEDVYDGYSHNADGSTPTAMPISSASGFPGAGTPNTHTVTVELYGSIAAAAIAMSNGVMDQDAAWQVVRPWHQGTIYYTHDPRYAIIPRED
jgi:hypothetical protein